MYHPAPSLNTTSAGSRMCHPEGRPSALVGTFPDEVEPYAFALCNLPACRTPAWKSAASATCQPLDNHPA
jgi:hypothetical protein